MGVVTTIRQFQIICYMSMVNLLSMLLLLCFDFPALSTVYLGLGSEFSSYLFQSPSFSTRVVPIPVAEHNFHVKNFLPAPLDSFTSWKGLNWTDSFQTFPLRRMLAWQPLPMNHCSHFPSKPLPLLLLY